MRIHVAGENALIVYFSDQASPEISAQVQHAAAELSRTMGSTLIDLIPSYASLLVLFDVLQTDHIAVRKLIRKTLSESQHQGTTPTAGKLVELPVYYSEASGPDLSRISDQSGLSIDEVINIHQAMEYRVYAIGFAPGFAYLGEVDSRIATPRLSTPRKRVPKGSVAIADQQTAVYPATSPGGWNIIGLCPTPMFDPQSEPTMPVSVGDRVRFYAINRDSFLEMGGDVETLNMLVGQKSETGA